PPRTSEGPRAGGALGVAAAERGRPVHHGRRDAPADARAARTAVERGRRAPLPAVRGGRPRGRAGVAAAARVRPLPPAGPPRLPRGAEGTADRRSRAALGPRRLRARADAGVVRLARVRVVLQEDPVEAEAPRDGLPDPVGEQRAQPDLRAEPLR